MKNDMRIFTFVIILPAVIMFTACKHKTYETPVCTAGSGGSVTFVVYADYSGSSIPNFYTHTDTAFVKFGTTTSPGTNPQDFNIYFLSEAGEDHIHCPGLKCGDYFIYRTASDSIANVSRYGGFGISISDTTGDIVIHVEVH